MEKVKTLDPSSREQLSVEVEKASGQILDFSQHKMIAAINNVVKEKNQPGMDMSVAKDFLSKLNCIIVGKDESEIIEYGEVVGADATGSADYVAPNKLIRDEVAAKYLDSINNEEDTDKKAKLVYHAIINMHLFKDGNGRTARALYLVLKHGDISDSDIYFLQHGKNEKGSSAFEEDNNIESAEALNSQATAEVIFDELNREVLPGWMKEFVRKNGTHSIYTFWQPEQNDLRGIGLNEDEIRVLHDIFLDSVLAGYATAELLSSDNREDLLKDNIVESSSGVCDYDRITFTHNKRKQEKYNSVFGSMSAEQYRRLINIYNYLKTKENEKVIEIIKSR